jgi:hypothetical protein
MQHRTELGAADILDNFQQPHNLKLINTPQQILLTEPLRTVIFLGCLPKMQRKLSDAHHITLVHPHKRKRTLLSQQAFGTL